MSLQGQSYSTWLRTKIFSRGLLIMSCGCAGPKKFVKGRLVSASLDVYIVMELGMDGDLFNFRCAFLP